MCDVMTLCVLDIHESFGFSTWSAVGMVSYMPLVCLPPTKNCAMGF